MPALEVSSGNLNLLTILFSYWQPWAHGRAIRSDPQRQYSVWSDYPRKQYEMGCHRASAGNLHFCGWWCCRQPREDKRSTPQRYVVTLNTIPCPNQSERTQRVGHNCVWYNQLPSWVTAGNFDAATLTSIIQVHCSTLVSHYAGQVSVSVVVSISCAAILNVLHHFFIVVSNVILIHWRPFWHSDYL